VVAQAEGAGVLRITDTAVEIAWANRPERVERIERSSLTATADHESVRLAASGRELLLMPTGKPANRDGRVRQAKAIAERLRT
jgi:hypothetical protein